MKVNKETEKQIKKLGEETFNAAILIVLMSTILTFVFVFSDSDSGFFITVIWATTIILVGILSVSYTKEFKKKIVTPLLESRNLKYFPDKMINEDLIKESKLLASYDEIHGSDLVQGDGFSFCQIITEERDKDRDEDGKTETHVMFNGIFYMCELPVSVSGAYMVVKSFVDFSKIFPITSKNRIKLDYEPFEKIFDVYGNDQIEGRYLFNLTFMQKLVEVYNEFEFEKLCICHGRLYAIFPNRELIEVPFLIGGLNDEKIEKIKDKVFFLASLKNKLFERHIKIMKIKDALY